MNESFFYSCMHAYICVLMCLNYILSVSTVGTNACNIPMPPMALIQLYKYSTYNVTHTETYQQPWTVTKQKEVYKMLLVGCSHSSGHCAYILS